MVDLFDIKEPGFLKDLNKKELEDLCSKLREYIIDVVSKNGGHLAPNLGVIELTIALHKVFNSPIDKLIWDVGHQTYTHKILTGRAEEFKTLRQFKGISGFPKRRESEHDVWETGHSSTSISAATGFAYARDFRNENYHIVAIIGDGSLTSGIALESLNHLGHTNKKVIIVLNDNEMSISANVGSLTRLLSKMRTTRSYLYAKKKTASVFKNVKFYNFFSELTLRAKGGVKKIIQPNNFFEDMGFKYFGPVDGHDINDIVDHLNFAKKIDGPSIVHVVTKKGKGYKPAEEDKVGFWHGVGPFNKETGEIYKNNKKNFVSWSKLISEGVLDLAKRDDKVIAITPAMINGSALNNFQELYPDRIIDVGIAEQHATTMAGGMAINGMRPFLPVYSSFIQRAYDQVSHDIAHQKLNILLGIDRAGIVGADGETHQGIYDIPLLRHIPNLTIMMPRNAKEAWNMIYTGLYNDGPYVIRYPRGVVELDLGDDFEFSKIKVGSWEVIRDGKDITLISFGANVNFLFNIVERNNINAKVINARFIKPIDENMVKQLIEENRPIIVYEESTNIGGFNSGILEYCQKNNYPVDNIHLIAIPDIFLEHGTKDELLKSIGMDEEAIVNKIRELL